MAREFIPGPYEGRKGRGLVYSRTGPKGAGYYTDWDRWKRQDEQEAAARKRWRQSIKAARKKVARKKAKKAAAAAAARPAEIAASYCPYSLGAPDGPVVKIGDGYQNASLVAHALRGGAPLACRFRDQLTTKPLTNREVFLALRASPPLGTNDRNVLAQREATLLRGLRAQKVADYLAEVRDARKARSTAQLAALAAKPPSNENAGEWLRRLLPREQTPASAAALEALGAGRLGAHLVSPRETTIQQLLALRALALIDVEATKRAVRALRPRSNTNGNGQLAAALAGH